MEHNGGLSELEAPMVSRTHVPPKINCPLGILARLELSREPHGHRERLWSAVG
jgi:hypothetical protein